MNYKKPKNILSFLADHFKGKHITVNLVEFRNIDTFLIKIDPYFARYLHFFLLESFMCIPSQSDLEAKKSGIN